MTAPDIIVVGGGVVGIACARWLAQQHLAVCIVDSDAEAGTASKAAPGLLAPLAETSVDDPLLSLKVRGRDLYHDLAPVLRDETGIDVELWTDGIVQIAFTPDDMQHLNGQIAWQRQMGFKSDWLSRDDLRARHPAVSPQALGAKVMPEGGAIHPGRLIEALRASATKLGVEIVRDARATDVLIEGGAVRGVRTETETRSAGAVVIAAGAWSGRIGGLPRPLSIEPIRGQMVAVDWPVGEPPGIIYGASGYVIYRADEALVGATREFVGFDSTVTEQGVAQVMETLQGIFPSLKGAPVKRSWAGLRPGSPDGHPIVGRDAAVEGLWYATGHGRNGFLLAAITGQIISRLFVETPVEQDIKAVDPARFWRT